MERIPIIENPKLFDLAVADMQQRLGYELPWLDHIFGICERNTRTIDGQRYDVATVYTGNNQYEQIEPCDKLGNFCFFYLKDPQEFLRNNDTRLHSPLSAVFWYNVSKVGSPYERNREAIKEDVLKVLQSAHLPNGTFVWSRLYEEPKNVFTEFTYDFVDNQFLMSPYAGFRIDATLYVDIPCVPLQ